MGVEDCEENEGCSIKIVVDFTFLRCARIFAKSMGSDTVSCDVLGLLLIFQS